jgi:phage gpG-like protein
MITATLVGDRQLVERIGAMPEAIRAELIPTVQRLGFAVEAQSKGAYLRGPRPTRLGVKTGRLSSSISAGGPGSRSRLETTSRAIYYYVGTNVSYGALWEHGFSRRVGAGARGGPRTLTGGARARYFAQHPPGVKQMAARPFLAPALQDLKPRILDELHAAMLRGMQKALRS